MYDVALVGAGLAGMAIAARVQPRGLSTLVLEAHALAGGCAGYYRRRGFAFDVGATTLVDFEPGGVGGELLASIGMEPPPGEVLPGYVAWLPDRTVTLFRDHDAWSAERLRSFGTTEQHRRFWHFLDRLSRVFWDVSRRGVRLPLRQTAHLISALRAVGVCNLHLLRYLRWTMADALHAFGLAEDRPLAALLSMLLEDTVHGRLDSAPLINGALGVTIRGAGLTRARGGMFGFWRRFTAHYRSLGGQLRTQHTVQAITRSRDGIFSILTSKGTFQAKQVVSAVPVSITARLAPALIGRQLEPFLLRDRAAQGGALVVFLGVPEDEVSGQTFTHHQLLHDYAQPLGNGNNMFISVSSSGDTDSAPPGHRAVMISTHCELAPWKSLDETTYAKHKHEVGKRLITLARRVYPELGCAAVVREVATPRTYMRFTQRDEGAVGGVRQTLVNTNQKAIPHDLGPPGFWLAGDTTWPGLGTVACALNSRIVADSILAHARRFGR